MLDSASTLLVDRHVTTRAYAEAGIARLLRIEFGSDDRLIGLMHVLDGAEYRPTHRAAPGDPPALDEPFPARLDLAALAEPR